MTTTTNRKFVVYITLYTGQKLPKWYIGSTNEARIKQGYNGSVTSKNTEKYINKSKKKTNTYLRHVLYLIILQEKRH